ncbi:MAG: hypothetical protein EZS28_007074 [Streblomastix strix]|uniref:Uncharacterized protein n=1 Tax=Streblomastix strix TaxID=222440 RepID=A0A5J4WR54_9EUKA|nr:MAG: hypothetical protein EZS28_007074 [Streblomastix strix]
MIDQRFSQNLDAFCERFEGKLKRDEIEDFFNPPQVIKCDSKQQNRDPSIYVMPLTPNDSGMMESYLRIRIQGSEGCSKSNIEFMKYYGGGIRNAEEAQRKVEIFLSQMWMEKGLPQVLIFLVYDKSKEVDKQGRRQASLIVGIDTNEKKDGIIRAGTKDEFGNQQENPDFYYICLQQDSRKHLARKGCEQVIKFLEFLYQKQIYAFDGLSATVHPENHPSEELQKRLGFQFLGQENRPYLRTECKFRNVYYLKFNKQTNIKSISEGVDGEQVYDIKDEQSQT